MADEKNIAMAGDKEAEPLASPEASIFGDTFYDIQDMKRLGKKQELKVRMFLEHSD